MTAHVGPTPSTRGPSTIFTVGSLAGPLGAAVADAVNAAASKTVVRNFIASIPPGIDKSNCCRVRCATLESGFHAFHGGKSLCLQLLSCMCYTQKHAQLDARAHEA